MPSKDYEAKGSFLFSTHTSCSFYLTAVSQSRLCRITTHNTMYGLEVGFYTPISTQLHTRPLVELAIIELEES